MRFKRIYIEITNTCNLQCSFCVQNQRVPKQMNVEEFQHCIDEIKEYCNFVYLHVLGEPLSHPMLNDILHILDQNKMQVTITTNGTLLYQKKEILLSHTIRQINVSLHSFPQHIQPNYFQHVFETSEALAKHGVYMNYRLWNLYGKDIQQVQAQAVLSEINAYYTIPQEEILMKRMQRVALKERISLHFEEVFIWPSLHHSYVNDIGRCLGMKDMCAILSNGDVVPCCLDSKGDCVLGNVHEMSFSDIIQSDKAQGIVNGFATHKVVETLCQHCSYRLRFYNASKR